MLSAITTYAAAAIVMTRLAPNASASGPKVSWPTGIATNDPSAS